MYLCSKTILIKRETLTGRTEKYSLYEDKITIFFQLRGKNIKAYKKKMKAFFL